MKMHYPTNYLVFDFETTGFDPEKESIVELAAIQYEDGEQKNFYHRVLNNEVDIPQEASDVHGITRQICEKQGVAPKGAIQNLAEMIQKAEAIVTHNGTNFDLRFLFAQMAKHDIGQSAGFSPLFFQQTMAKHIDTAAMFKARELDITRGWNEPIAAFNTRVLNTRAYGVKFNLAHCCKELGVDTEGITAHRADGDVEMTNEVYKALTKQKNESNT